MGAFGMFSDVLGRIDLVPVSCTQLSLLTIYSVCLVGGVGSFSNNLGRIALVLIVWTCLVLAEIQSTAPAECSVAFRD